MITCMIFDIDKVRRCGPQRLTGIPVVLRFSQFAGGKQGAGGKELPFHDGVASRLAEATKVVA